MSWKQADFVALCCCCLKRNLPRGVKIDTQAPNQHERVKIMTSLVIVSTGARCLQSEAAAAMGKRNVFHGSRYT